MGEIPGRPAQPDLVRSRPLVLPARDPVVEPTELRPAQRGEQIRESIVVSHLGVLVVDEGLSGLQWRDAGLAQPRTGTRSPACRRRWW